MILKLTKFLKTGKMTLEMAKMVKKMVFQYFKNGKVLFKF